MSQTDDQLIAQFLAGELSAEEKEVFLQRLEAEPDLREQFELEQQLFASLDDTDWAFAENTDHAELKAYAEAFGSEKTQALKASIHKASEAYHAGKEIQIKPKGRQLWIYGIAAAFALAITFYFFPTRQATPGELYAEYLAQTELPDVSTRSASDEAAALMRAQGYLNNKEFEKAANAFETLLIQIPGRSELYINLAYCQTELNQFANAISTLDRLINSELLDAQKGHWFQSLVYLKSEELDKSKTVLQHIIDNAYYNHQLARELFKELD